MRAAQQSLLPDNMLIVCHLEGLLRVYLSKLRLSTPSFLIMLFNYLLLVYLILYRAIMV